MGWDEKLGGDTDLLGPRPAQQSLKWFSFSYNSFLVILFS